MQIDLKYIATEAPKRKKEFLRLFNLKGKAIRKLDEQFQTMHEEVFKEINCLDCANCCKSFGPKFNDRDIAVLANHFKMKTADFFQEYLHIDEDDDTVFQVMPCPFLMSDNYCSVYDARPKACREYPHTDRKRVMQLSRLTITNASTCPAVFEILDRLCKKNNIEPKAK